ncbi:Arginase, mitochondrial [Linum perenne]
MSMILRRGMHYLERLKAANVPNDLIEKGQNRVIDASLTLIRERAKLKVLSECSDLVPSFLACLE